MSARPGLCGGHRVTGVPTAIDQVANSHAASPLPITNTFNRKADFISWLLVGLSPGLISP